MYVLCPFALRLTFYYALPNQSHHELNGEKEMEGIAAINPNYNHAMHAHAIHLVQVSGKGWYSSTVVVAV